MALTNKKVVKVTNKSGFDKSFKNMFTMPVGTLVPLLCDEVIPNTTVDLEVALNACLPPLATDAFLNADICLEAFFQPTRNLYGGYQDWLTQNPVYDESTQTDVVPGIPRLALTSTNFNTGATTFDPGSLCDYLGYKFSKTDRASLSSTTLNTGYTYGNIFPLLAYHKIWDDWYRNSQVQKPAFYNPLNLPATANTAATRSLAKVPFTKFPTTGASFGPNSTFGDGVRIDALRQRNFGIDGGYFTNATPKAQLGAAQSVDISNATALTVSALRAASSLQCYLERSGLGSYRLQDFVKTHFGADLGDGVAQKAIFLGSSRINCYTKGIYQTSPALSSGGNVVPNNPMFTTVGAEYGSMSSNGVAHLIKNFTTDEPGYIFVMVSLVPKVTYSSGVLRQNMRYTVSQGSQTDLADPLLQNTGNQPIFAGELCGADAVMRPGQVFGYIDKFADWMCREDELHGLLRDGYDLQAFALQRSFSYGDITGINSSFLEIPQNYLDQVAAASTGISKYGAWVDSYLNYKVSMPLAKYSVPSLQDPAAEHGHDVVIQTGGKRIV